MTLSKEASSALLATLTTEPSVVDLAARIAAGTMPIERLREALSLAVADHPTLSGLDGATRKGLLGRLESQLKRSAPRTASPGERLVAMDEAARNAWRTALARQAVMPVAFLAEQARQGLAAPAGDPRRRDLGWDLVNLGVTAVRYAAIVALAEYVRGGASDPPLNRELLDAVARPADGTWSELLFAPKAGAAHALTALLQRRGSPLSCLASLGTPVAAADLPSGLPFGTTAGLPAKRPESVHGLALTVVSFRNELVHGAYARVRPDDAALGALALLVDALLAFLEPVLTRPVVVAREDGVWSANGIALAPLEDPLALLGDAPLDASWFEAPVLIDGAYRVTLGPWLALADLETAASRNALEADGDAGTAAELGLVELCFFNKFESELLHYLGFAARAQLAHVELVETARAEAAYASFARHVEALRLRASPPGARLREPILRFDALATFHGENFVGRRDVLAAIERFVRERPAPMGLVAAPPGLGKSSIFSHFYREHGKPDAADGWLFHFSARAEQRDNPAVGLRSLIAQAEQQIARNVAAPTKRPPLPWSYDELSARLAATLAELGAVMAAHGTRAVMVLDALDEQTPRPGGAPESIFGAIPRDLPDNVVALVSVRLGPDGRAVGIEAGDLGLPRCRPIEGAAPLSGLSPDDVRELVRERLAASRPELAAVSDAVLTRVAEAARRPEDGTLDPFYLRFLADGVREGSVDLGQPGNVPAGLESFFDALWWGLDASADHLLHRLLGMLAEMEGFGSDALFADALRRPEDEVARLRHGVHKLLMQTGAGGGEARYGLFHDRFRWYVQSKFSARDRALALHLPLLEACRRFTGAADAYAARFTSYHLRALALHEGLRPDERATFEEELWRLVFDDGFVERAFAALKDERAIVADFGRAFDVVRPRLHHTPDERERRAARLTALAERASRTIAGVANLALARVNDFAREGDAVRVIQLAERHGAIALRWMLLLRAAAAMREVGLEAGALFDAILATEGAELAWSDAPTFERLLSEAGAPDDVATFVRTRIPAKPDVRELERAEREAAAAREERAAKDAADEESTQQQN